MTIFSVDLNRDFKILDKKVYFNENDFFKLCKSNSLDIRENELAKYELENKLIKVNPNNFPLISLQYDYNIKDLCKYIEESEYQLNGLNEQKSLYPEWLLFYVAVQKFSFLYTSKNEFEKHISFFKKIAAIRHKDYIRKAPDNYIFILDENRESFINALNKSFNILIADATKVNNEADLFNFLAFLCNFHKELKSAEKYKLMWNLETYITESIYLLTDRDIDFEQVYKHHKDLLRNKYRFRGEVSPLHEIQINIPLYIKENKSCLDYNPDNEPSILDKINNCSSDDVTIDKLLEVFTSNDKIQSLIFSRLEIDRFYNSNKFNEFVIKSLIKNFVLEIESLINDKVPKNRGGLFENIKQFKKGSHKFSEYQDKVSENASWSELSEGIKNIKIDNLDKQYEETIFEHIDTCKDIDELRNKVAILNKSNTLTKKDSFLQEKINAFLDSFKPKTKDNNDNEYDENEELKENITNLLKNRHIEKHLMIYYHFRNYFAHNSVNVDELIWSDERKYVRAILESAIITIYHVATFE